MTNPAYLIRQVTPHHWQFLTLTKEFGREIWNYPYPRAQHYNSRAEAEAWMRYHIRGHKDFEHDKFEPLADFVAKYDADGRLIEEYGEPVTPICQTRIMRTPAGTSDEQ